MSKPGRNDPCPCGSGKKYKKCCGLDNVIAFNPNVYKEELEQLVEDLMEFMDETYNDEMMQHAVEHLPDEVLMQEHEADFAAIISLFYAWAVFHLPVDRGQTVYDHFYTQAHQAIKYPVVRKSFSTWGESVTGIFTVIFDENENDEWHLALQDEQTLEIYPYGGDLNLVEEGEALVGTIIPFMDSYSFFLGALPLAVEHTGTTFDALGKLNERGELVNEQFPSFLANMMQVPSEEIIMQLEWIDHKYQVTAQLFTEHMEEKGYEPFVIQTAIILWNYYCKEQNPIVRKPAAYAAVVDYFLQTSFSEGPSATQTEIANEYGVSVGTVSTNYQKVKGTMESALDQLADAEADLGLDRSDDDSMYEPATSVPASLEQDLRALQQAVEKQDFSSDEEMEAFIDDFLSNAVNPHESGDPREQAQNLIYQAHNETGRKQRALIDEALDLYPHSPDAYLLRASLAEPFEVKFGLIKQAVEAGENDLGKEFIVEHKGHFWGLVETRPYMRALEAYAALSYMEGSTEEAIDIYEEMLALNPNDNQGIRDQLMTLYIGDERLREATQLAETFEGDRTAAMCFSKVLIEFKQHGASKKALQLLEEADEANPHVIDYLVDLKAIPEQTFDYVGLGDESEAIVYAGQNIHLWANTTILFDEYFEV